ncbi:MAG: ABC transporter permease, partial [Pirellulales bacterium]
LDQNPEFRRLQPPELTPRPLPDFEDVNTANRNAYITQSWGEKRGVVVRWMIGLRMAIFGDWTVPSVCGTDALGRDMLSRLFWGSRVSLIVGIVATLVSLIIGVTYGAIAGYVGGWLDDVMMRIVDILYSIPFIFVVIFIITILADENWKANLERVGVDRIMIFYLLIGAIFWPTMSRVVRGQVISLRSEQFVEAARVIGASRGRIIFMHLVPNILGVVIIYLTLTIPSVMLFEAFLSFLGLGVEAPDISWGSLANEGMKSITPIRTFWWLVVFPGLALAGTLYALNFLGDGLRDAMDPRLKNT